MDIHIDKILIDVSLAYKYVMNHGIFEKDPVAHDAVMPFVTNIVSQQPNI